MILKKMRRLNRLQLLVLFVFFPIIVFGQNYLWPTNASKHITSSFCEYRPGHYHSGIDIKTWNQVGYPCYAIDDGEIDRLRVSPFGYGKVIYLKLKDGRIAVYAHLQKFNKKIEKAVRKKQLQNERYTIRWRPKNWKVKKGEVIAFTGQTGIGSPHLHFEIRDGNDHPFNVLKFYNKVEDHIAPTLQSVLIIPQTPGSKVNGSFLPKVFKLSRISDNIYVIKEPIKVRGKIGVAVKGYDKADGVYNKFAFYKTVLNINNKDYFHIQYDRLNFDISGQINIEIYYPKYAKTKQVYHKLYIEPFNELQLYDRKLGNGLIDIADQNIKFSIEVSDWFGNTSHISGTLLAENTRPAKLKFINQLNDFVFFRLELPADLKELHFLSSPDGKTWKNIEYFEILERKFAGNNQTMLIKIKLNTVKDKLIKTLLTTADNEEIQTAASLSLEANEKIDFKVVNLGKYAALRFNHIEDASDLKLDIDYGSYSTTFQPQIVNDFYEKIIAANSLTNGFVNVRLHAGQKTYLDSSLYLYALLPGQKQELKFFNNYCAVYIRNESLYDTLLMQANKLELDVTQITVPMYSSVVELQPDNQVFKNDITVRLHYDSAYVNPERMGLYKYGKNGRLSLIGAELDTINHFISGRTDTFGKFVIAADTTAPGLNIIHPKNNQKLKRLKKIQFYAKDELSEIGSDANLQITVDNRFVLPEWDPEKDIINGYLDWKLPPGKHEIMAKVKDKAGNVNEQKITITIL